ncbi:rhomboid family intramembrane serine protease [Niveibacterium sp. COAC-50]|uniref:rhomboid family intramembrane serine protease n=1 Tax=Niveibacterium sp. COAC-50 TaxID=2729384 RepID=UPI001551C223|nr:rhomboid family intramembrane serine protease [Niveibacterium sp. COAC-50]
MNTHLRWPSASLAIAAISLAAIALPELWVARFELTRAPVAGAALWQLWSGHLLHFGAAHALTDLVTLITAAAIVESALGSRRVSLLYCVAAPVLSLGTLLTAPALTAYRGASALAVMMSFAAAGVLWREARLRAPVVLLITAFAAKLAGDALGSATDLAGLPAGVAVVWQAHAAGALLGAGVALRLAREGSAGRYGMIST